MECLNCKAQNSNDAKFCFHCGQKLTIEKKGLDINAIAFIGVLVVLAGIIFIFFYKSSRQINHHDNQLTVATDSSLAIYQDSLAVMQLLDSAVALGSPSHNISDFNEAISVDSTVYSQPIPSVKIYYCVAIFELKSKRRAMVYEDGETKYKTYYATKVSNVFEMTDLSKDNYYRELDQMENSMMEYDREYNVSDRRIETFDSYAEASEARQNLLK